LKEDNRQSILTIFNWTEGELKRDINLMSLGLKEAGNYRITEVLGDESCCNSSSGTINLVQPAHSVRMLKLIDNAIPAGPPALKMQSPAAGKAGEALAFSGEGLPAQAPVLTFHWDFGDGSATDGMKVQHTYTHAGEYDVHVTATGLDATTNSKNAKVKISGNIATRFVPADKKRPE
jgi:alpha-galactosidase